MTRLITTAFGAPALEALAEQVHRAKAHDALAPVVVVVPTDRLGVVARRGLARIGAGGRPGIAGISVVTLRRLAESIATPTLTAGGRMPVTRPVLVSAIHRLLLEEPGAFAEVAAHPETARALAQAHDHLRLLTEPMQSDVAGTSPVVADVLRLHRRAEGLLAAGHFDEVELLTSAAALLQDGRASVPPIAVFLPSALEPAQAELVRALTQLTEVTAIVGRSGAGVADATVMQSWATALGVGIPAAPERVLPAPTADAVIAATDPDAEVRAVVRDVVARLAGGTPGHRIAVLYGSRDPYARLLAEHLSEAGVTVNGRGVRPTSERILGRALRRTLDLGEFRRDVIMALLADAPIQWDGSRAPATSWERLSRRAGVVRGSDWSTRLAEYARRKRLGAAEARALPDAGSEAGAWDERSAAEADALAAFIADLRDRLDQLTGAEGWAAAATVLDRLWREVLGADRVGHLPDEERRAVDVIDRVIRSLPALDQLAAPYSLPTLRDLLDLELDSDLDRVGRAGIGVHVGPVADGMGMDLDAVYVVGTAEGLLPPRPADDPLLPDSARELTDGILPTLAERIHDQHRQFLAALAAAPEGTADMPRRVLAFPRGDLRRGGVRVPSRWLMPTLVRISGDERLVATEWERAIGSPGLMVEASYSAAVTTAALPGSDQEWRQRAHAAGLDQGDPVFERAREMRSARRNRGLTRFEGLVGTHEFLSGQTDGVLSPTSLEAWYSCPHGYLVRHVLGVREVEDPEEIVQISAMDRGNVLHRALDRLLKEAIDAGTQPRDGEPWTERDAERLERIAREEFAAAEASGRVGISRLWHFAARGLREDLRRFLEADSRRRADGSLTPLASELTFGREGQPPAEFPLGDGRSLHVRGSVDRVDEGPAGLVVIDYKSGKPKPYKQLSATNPTDHGRYLQLPLYAAAARQRLGRPEAPVEVAYWFITRKHRFEIIPFTIDDAGLDATREVLRVAVDGIEAGLFPPRPTAHSNGYGCAYCDPDGLGERTSVERFEQLLEAPALREYADVIAGEVGIVSGEGAGESA